MELEMILPLILSVFVVILVSSLLCVVIKKRTTIDTLYSNSENGAKQAYDLEMTQMDKTRAKVVLEPRDQQQQEQRASIYYPSPYASDQMTGEQVTSGYIHIQGTLKPCLIDHKATEGGHYATVKRTPRLPKAERNIYDYPVPLDRRCPEGLGTSFQSHVEVSDFEDS